jgi:hypothetical protein
VDLLAVRWMKSRYIRYEAREVTAHDPLPPEAPRTPARVVSPEPVPAAAVTRPS